MPVESDIDRLTMLVDFGELATFSPGVVWPNRSSDHATVRMIFDAEYLELLAGAITVNSNNPIALARTIDVADAVRNSMIERGADKYKVINVQPDGTGITLLELEGPR